MRKKNIYNLLILFSILKIVFPFNVFASYVNLQKIKSILPLETTQQIKEECASKYILSLDKECHNIDKVQKGGVYVDCNQKTMEELYDIMDMQLSSIVGVDNLSSYKQKCDKYKGYAITKWLPAKQIVEKGAIKGSSECQLANDKLAAAKRCYSRAIAHDGGFDLKSVMNQECGKFPDVEKQITHAVDDRLLLESILTKIIYENRKKCRTYNYNKKIEESEFYKKLIVSPDRNYTYKTKHINSDSRIIKKETNNSNNKEINKINTNNKKDLSKTKPTLKNEKVKNKDSVKTKTENDKQANNNYTYNTNNENFSEDEFEIDSEDTSYVEERPEDLIFNYGSEIYLIFDPESNCKDIATNTNNKIIINDDLDLCRNFFTHDMQPIFKYANKYHDYKLCLATHSKENDDNANAIKYSKYLDIKMLYPFISFNSTHNLIENNGTDLLKYIKAHCELFYTKFNDIKLNITESYRNESNNTILKDFLNLGNQSGYCEDIDLGITKTNSIKFNIDDTYDEQIIHYGMIKNLFSDDINKEKTNQCLIKLNDTCNKLKGINSLRCREAYRYLDTTIKTFIRRDNILTDNTPRFKFYKINKDFKDYVDKLVANYIGFSHNFREMLKTLTPNMQLKKFY